MKKEWCTQLPSTPLTYVHRDHSPKLVRVAPESPGKDSRLWRLGIASFYGLYHGGYDINASSGAIGP